MRARFLYLLQPIPGALSITLKARRKHRRKLRVADLVLMPLSSVAMSESGPVFEGFRISPGYLDTAAQQDLVARLRKLIAESPFYEPVMPRTGKPFSVRMTNLGPLGWVSDRTGYRYQPEHPVTGKPWPDIPGRLLEIWHDLTRWPAPPECCLVNYYADEGTRMGLHRDEDEEERRAPVLSISLGDTAVFRMGGLARKGPTRSVRLASGDALVMEGPARDAYHGVDRILAGSSSLLKNGGRINLTLRRVTVPR